MIEHAKNWKDNNLVGINAENIDFYNKTINLLKPFIICARPTVKIREYLPKYVEDRQSQLTLIIRAHEKGHWCTLKTYGSLKNRYTWRGMKKQIDDYIKTCDRCSTRSRLYTPCVPGVVIDPPKEPFEIINMNIYTYNGNKLLLVIDELSRYIWVKENVNMQFV